MDVVCGGVDIDLQMSRGWSGLSTRIGQDREGQGREGQGKVGQGRGQERERERVVRRIGKGSEGRAGDRSEGEGCEKDKKVEWDKDGRAWKGTGREGRERECRDRDGS